MRSGDVVYTVRGFNNQWYDGIFAYVFTTEEKMTEKVEELMAQDMHMTRDEFIALMNANEAEFDERFTDSSRSFEECFAEQAYYCENGNEFTWGMSRVI